jgi:hypothetical protein
MNTSNHDRIPDSPKVPPAPTFEEELTKLINRFSQENTSNTPDFILAQYLSQCLNAFNSAMIRRTDWYQAPDHTFGVVVKKVQ